jgi:MFS family permease
VQASNFDSPTLLRRLFSPAFWVVFAGVAVAMHIGKLPPAIPALKTELHTSLMQAGFLLSMVQFAGMTLGLWVGLFADVLGLKRCMITGLVVLTLSSLLGASAETPETLLLTRFFEGLGFLLTAMPAPSLIRLMLQGQSLSRALGWWAAYIPIGTAFALWLGPWVIKPYGWSLWWVLMSGMTALAALGLYKGVPAGLSNHQDGFSLSPWGNRLSLTLSSKGPWLVALCFGCYSAQWLSVIGFLPTVTQDMGLSATSSGVVTAGVALVNMIGNVASGFFLARALKKSQERTKREQEAKLAKEKLHEELNFTLEQTRQKELEERLKQNPFYTPLVSNRLDLSASSSKAQRAEPAPERALELTRWGYFWTMVSESEFLAVRLLWIGLVVMGLGATLAYAQWGGQALPAEYRFASILLFSAVGGMVPGTLFALGVKVSPSNECVAITVGWMQQWSSLGQFFGPPLVAWMATRMGGWQMTWSVTAFMATLGLVVTYQLGVMLIKQRTR